MKYMKIGIKPDTFYTEEASRSVRSDVPPDLIIQVNNTRYTLHKCGLLQRLCSNSDSSSHSNAPVALHDIPGGEEAFELCAKFCYGITINLSAHNFVEAFSAAKFLRMTESVSQGNFIMKLELFFDSCILHGWKDCIAILQSVGKFPGWSDSPRIVRPCIDSVINKIITHPSKVTWSFTYTRPGYSSKQHKSAPRDWWTEDIAELNLDIFRTIISSVRSTKQLPPPLIGEALHVYACKHLPDPAEKERQNTSEDVVSNYQRMLECIVSMIPLEYGSVAGRFLLKLLKFANLVGSSPSLKAELIRRAGRQLDEVAATDLIFPSPSNPNSYDVGMVEALLESFLAQFHLPLRQEDTGRMATAMTRVANIFDTYLQVIANNHELPVSEFIDLIESLPDIARQRHDDLYQAIDTYLKEHPELSKAEKKQLCHVMDCRKLSPDARTHAITNDRLPLRIVVQLLFLEQERTARGGSSVPPNRTSYEPSTSSEVQNSRSRTEELAQIRQRGEPMNRSLSISEPKEARKEKEMVRERQEGSSAKSKSKQTR